MHGTEQKTGCLVVRTGLARAGVLFQSGVGGKKTCLSDERSKMKRRCQTKLDLYTKRKEQFFEAVFLTRQ